MSKSPNLDHILLFLGCGTMFSLFLKENFNSIFLIAFIITLFVSLCIKKDFGGLKNGGRKYLPMVAYLLLAVLGVLINSESNLNYVIRLVPFGLTLLFFYYFGLAKVKVKYLLMAFVAGNILLLLFLDGLALFDMVQSKSLYVEQDGRLYYRFLYSRYTQGFFNHIYLGIYSILSIVLVQQFQLSKFLWQRTAVSMYLGFHIILLGSRAVIIAAILASLLSLIIASFRRKRFIKYIVILLGILIVSTSVAYYYKDTLLFNRYSQVFEWYNKRDLLLKRNFSINNRVKIYIVGYSMLKDIERYGINGSGTASDEIQKKYDDAFKDKFALKTITYNTHNQYINNFIDWGLTGVLLTLLLMLFAIRYTYLLQMNWATFFWIFFALVLMMESVLIRHRGIVLFVVFYSFFLSQKSALSHEN